MDVTPIGENFDLLDLPVENPNQIHLMNLRDYFGTNIEANVNTFEQIFRPLYQRGNPAVAVGEERFRMSVMATHSEQDIYDAVAIFKRVFGRYSS